MAVGLGFVVGVSTESGVSVGSGKAAARSSLSLASTVASTARSWVSLASTVASMLGVGSAG